jgi:hypothetical protein
MALVSLFVIPTLAVLLFFALADLWGIPDSIVANTKKNEFIPRVTRLSFDEMRLSFDEVRLRFDEVRSRNDDLWSDEAKEKREEEWKPYASKDIVMDLRDRAKAERASAAKARRANISSSSGAYSSRARSSSSGWKSSSGCTHSRGCTCYYCNGQYSADSSGD